MGYQEQTAGSGGPVARRRYERERSARRTAEQLLEAKSRELYETNLRLTEQREALERAVLERTAEAEEAAKARTRAETANEAKSNFLASMSHEIRTPLHGVLGMMSAMEGTPLSSEQRDLLQAMKESGTLLRTVVNDILDISKIEAGQLELSPAPFYLPNVLKSLKQHFGLSAAAKGLTLMFDAEKSCECWLTGDEFRLRQVFGNVLSNAIKFTAHGTVLLQAKVAKEGGGVLRLEVRVEDTGIGMSDYARARLFKPFAQADPKIAHLFGGSGLGLTICRRLCHMMEGAITLDGEEGRGTVAEFQVRFAMADPPSQRANCADLDSAEALLRRGQWCILVVDDSAVNRKVVAQYLKRYEVTVIEAEDGAKAVDLWRRRKPDLILMDINMPVMGGIAAALRIREEAVERSEARVPIVALTANAMSHQVNDYLEAGLDAHVAKPVGRSELVRVIGSFLVAAQ
ncbi:response regulator [uncultured Lentibacter sp.]|jgi:signal transduction histidine kinase/CheY-like chemotaxis protein|uniref:response regulator n=1 Tax=uncultured Lentibacter sp. TaxID=1659309 RepID=UPI00262F62DE|nr:response regulator [uncultured Lentibacter sp.]